MTTPLKALYLEHLTIIERNLSANPSERHDFLQSLFEEVDWKAILAQDSPQGEIRSVVARLVQLIPNSSLYLRYKGIVNL